MNKKTFVIILTIDILLILYILNLSVFPLKLSFVVFLPIFIFGCHCMLYGQYSHPQHIKTTLEVTSTKLFIPYISLLLISVLLFLSENYFDSKLFIAIWGISRILLDCLLISISSFLTTLAVMLNLNTWRYKRADLM